MKKNDYINNNQSASEDYRCGLFVYRIYEGLYIYIYIYIYIYKISLQDVLIRHATKAGL